MKYKRFYDDDETFRQKMLARVRVVEKKIREFTDLPTRVKAQKILNKLKTALKIKVVRWVIVGVLWTGISALCQGIDRNNNMRVAAIEIQVLPENYTRWLSEIRGRIQRRNNYVGVFLSQNDIDTTIGYYRHLVRTQLSMYSVMVSDFADNQHSRTHGIYDEIRELLRRDVIDNIIRHDISSEYLERMTDGRDSEGYRWAQRLNELTQEYRRYYNRDIAENRQERAETERIAREAARMAEQRRREREAEFGH